MKTDILYEDGDVLVVYKPAGFGVQTAKTGQQDVVSELKNYLRQHRKQQSHSQAAEASAPYLGIIHRLDQPVEGLLVFAKNKKAAASLSKQLQEQGNGGILHKQYYAVLCGKPATEEGELVDYLYKNKENMAEVAAGQGVSGAKRAVLKYHVLQVLDIKNLPVAEGVEDAVGIQPTGSARNSGSIPSAESVGSSESIQSAESAGSSENIQSTESAGSSESVQSAESTGNAGSIQSAESAGNAGSIQSAKSAGEPVGIQLVLADIHIQTGRFHQIRAQMAHAGTPLLGDLKYGNEETKALSQKLKMQHVTLCAYSLAFLHPVSKKEMRFQIEPRGSAFSFFHMNEF